MSNRRKGWFLSSARGPVQERRQKVRQRRIQRWKASTTAIRARTLPTTSKGCHNNEDNDKKNDNKDNNNNDAAGYDSVPLVDFWFGSVAVECRRTTMTSKSPTRIVWKHIGLHGLSVGTFTGTSCS